MIRISLYHWLPIADNILSEIEQQLRAMPLSHVNEIEVERDAVSFMTVFQFRRDFRLIADFPVRGKINERGFCQHVLNIAPIPGVPINALLNELVPELKGTIAELLYAVSPEAVRNKLAILQVGITPFQKFQSITLDPPIADAAREFLINSPVSAIALDEFQSDTMRAGFNLPALMLNVPPCDTDSAAYSNEKGECFLFYSTVYHPDEWATHDSVLYKYCALVLYVRFLAHTISILKDTRDHIFPLRRRVARALQSGVAEHFDALNQIKRYLSYVNIKLPLIQKVIHNLQATRASETFAAKLATFDEPVKVFNYPAIRSIEQTAWQPHSLLEKIDREVERLQALFDEDLEEIQIVSTELSQVLQGSFLSEQLQVSMQSLDASQSLLEIERSSKNLANANKWMSVLLIFTLGMLIADTFGISLLWTLIFGLGVLLLGVAVTMFALHRHESYFRLVVPIRSNLSPDALAGWIGSHRLIKNKSNGNQITCTWREPLNVRVFEKGGRRSARFTHRFDITVDLHRRGFLNTITLETEYLTALFDLRDIVEEVFFSLRSSACLSEAQESSLYATALAHLEIPLDENLPALNRLLMLPSAQVSQIVTTGASQQEESSFSRQDLHIMQDLNAQPRAYKVWLHSLLTQPESTNLLSLLGLQNVQQKLTLLERLEEAHVKRT